MYLKEAAMMAAFFNSNEESLALGVHARLSFAHPLLFRS
jgi:hypothetical protein